MNLTALWNCLCSEGYVLSQVDALGMRVTMKIGKIKRKHIYLHLGSASGGYSVLWLECDKSKYGLVLFEDKHIVVVD